MLTKAHLLCLPFGCSIQAAMGALPGGPGSWASTPAGGGGGYPTGREVRPQASVLPPPPAGWFLHSGQQCRTWVAPTHSPPQGQDECKPLFPRRHLSRGGGVCRQDETKEKGGLKWKQIPGLAFYKTHSLPPPSVSPA